jgi:hypothetical protein
METLTYEEAKRFIAKIQELQQALQSVKDCNCFSVEWTGTWFLAPRPASFRKVQEHKIDRSNYTLEKVYYAMKEAAINEIESRIEYWRQRVKDL